MILAPDVQFEPKFRVVGCVVEYSDKVLLLKRSLRTSQPGTWGFPSGKIDYQEDETTAMLRELKEETGIEARVEDLIHVACLAVQHEDYYLIYTLFGTKVSGDDVEIDPNEHDAYQWIPPDKVATDVNGIEDLNECLEIWRASGKDHL